MPKRTAIFCTLFALCLFMSGCGTGYPYYTTDGSPESRVVLIHLDENTTEKVHCGSGMGGGLEEEHKMLLGAGQDAVVEDGKAKVTMQSSGGIIYTIKSVEYDGKPVLYHEPLF